MMSKGVRSKIDSYTYQEILEKTIPKLAQKDPVTITKLLADKLNKAIFLDAKSKGMKGGTDLSYSWRPAIEEHQNNWDLFDVKDLLVKALRDTLEAAGKQNIDTLKKSLEIIKEKNYDVFRRLELHIYRLYSDEFLENIESVAVKYFGLGEFVHEYYLLLQKVFPKLQDPTKKNILDLIEKGPSSEKYRGTSEEFKIYKKRWKADKLEPIKDHIPKEKQEEYGEIVKELGTSELSNFVVTHSAFKEVIPQSDLPDEISVDKVLDFIKSHQVENPALAEDDGTARKFKTLVETNPYEYSTKASELIEAHPIFSYKFLWALTDATKKKKKIDWFNVLPLCQYFVENKKTADERSFDYLIGQIAELLETNMQFAENSIKFEEHEKVWKIIEKLVEFAEDDSSWARDFPKTNFDAYSISINSAIGKSMHAVMQYAVWCYHGLKKEGKKYKKLVTEVRELLTQRLNPKIDKTVSTYAVLGFHIHNLLILDKEWTRKNLQYIFKSGEYSILGDAAWDAYLLQRIYSNVFAELKSEYKKRINELKPREPNEEITRDARKRLAEHIGITYLSKIKESDELFELFIKKAPSDLLRYCIEFIGRRLRDCKKENKPPEQDVKQLWNKDELKKLPEMGWLFVNSFFDKKFNLEMLGKLLEETKGKIEPIYQVPEELATYANDFPLETIEYAYRIVFAYHKSWEIHHMQKHLEEIIKTIKLSGNEKAINRTNELINFLGEKGYEKFRDLL